MESDSDAEAESVESEISISSSTSSCDLGPSLAHGNIDPAAHFICPSNPAEFEKLICLKREKVMEKMQPKPGVIFFDRIPDGFGLEQLRKFFSQYGRILRTRICDKEKKRQLRPAKGGSKHRTAYMEFARADDARCAVQACAGSGIYDNLFRCSFLPVEEVPKNAFSSDSHSEAFGARKKSSKSPHNRDRSTRKRLQSSHHKRPSSKKYPSLRMRKGDSPLQSLKIEKRQFPGSGE